MIVASLDSPEETHPTFRLTTTTLLLVDDDDVISQLLQIMPRMSRWSKSGVLDRVFEKLQVEQIVRIKLEAVSLDSTSIKVHSDGTGALRKRTTVDRQVPGRWNTKVHMVAADARTAIAFSLLPGNAHDAPRDGSCCGSSSRARRSAHVDG
jgi:hypothetical protein